MDKGLKVTVGIPFYNAGMYLGFAVQSIINQTYADWELILVDDGSTDNSLQIAQSYSDHRIRVIHDATNRGISFRLNQIISEAKGNFIARMDADDIAFPNRLEEQIKKFIEDSSLDIVDSESVIINEKNEVIGTRAVKTDFTNIRQVFNSIRFIHPTVMYKKDFIAKFMYNGEFNGAEDQDLWIRSFESARVGKINRPLYFYRESGKINLKTYLSRCSQLIRLYKAHRNKISASYYWVLMARVKLKTLIYSVSKIMNVDSYWIRRRNRKLTEDEVAAFKQQLQKAISTE